MTEQAQRATWAEQVRPHDAGPFVESLALPCGWTVTVTRFGDGSARVSFTCGDQAPTINGAAINVSVAANPDHPGHVLQVVENGGWAEGYFYDPQGRRLIR